MAKEYGDSYDPELDEDEDGQMPPDSDSDDEAPPLLQPGDIEHLVDDFLDDFQITETGQLKRTIPGATPMDKLENMRKSIDPGKAAILAAVERQARQKEKPIPMPVDIDEKEDKWDCETILSK
jgi:protein LTV1